MGFKFNKGGEGGNFEPVPPGNHRAYCDMAVDMGLQEGFEGKLQEKVYLRWSCPDERVEITREGQVQQAPAIIGATFTNSMHEKSSLRKLLESWRAREFTEAEAESFDTENILGAPCLLNVVHREKNNRVYANVASATPLAKTMEKPQVETDMITVSRDDRSKMELLPEWLRNKCEEGWERLDQRQETNPSLPDFDDLEDVPF